MPSKWTIDIDDSSDDETTTANVKQYDIETQWQSFYKTLEIEEDIITIQKYEMKGIKLDSLKKCFVLHALGINMFYEEKVQEKYRAKKEKLALKEEHTKMIQDDIKDNVSCMLFAMYLALIELPDDEQIDFAVIRNNFISFSKKNFNDTLIDKLSEMIWSILCDHSFNKEKAKEDIQGEKKNIDKLLNASVDEIIKQTGTADFSVYKSIVEIAVSYARKLGLVAQDTSKSPGKNRKPVETELYDALEIQDNLDDINDHYNFVREIKLSYENKNSQTAANVYKENKDRLFFALAKDLRTKQFKGLQRHINKEVVEPTALDLDDKTLKKIFYEMLSCAIDAIQIVRPTYPQLYNFVSKDIQDLIVNRRLLQRSQTRIIKTRKSQEGNKITPRTTTTLWTYNKINTDALSSETGIVEKNKITSTGKKVDLVEDGGAYKKLLEKVKELGLYHSQIAIFIKELIRGKNIDELKKEGGFSMIFVKDSQKETLLKLKHLIAGTEAGRNPAHLIVSMMILDMIEERKLYWDNVLDDKSPVFIPMIMKGAVIAATTLHSIFNLYMPYPYSYRGDEDRGDEDDQTLVAAESDMLLVSRLINAEANVFIKYEEEIEVISKNCVLKKYFSEIEKKKANSWFKPL